MFQPSQKHSNRLAEVGYRAMRFVRWNAVGSGYYTTLSGINYHHWRAVAAVVLQQNRARTAKEGYGVHKNVQFVLLCFSSTVNVDRGQGELQTNHSECLSVPSPCHP
jgi:hypothetical protein